MRLIDADKLVNKYKGHHDFYLNAWDGDFKFIDAKDKARCDELTNCIAEIVNAPTIEIVHCGECKWYGNEQKKIYECCTHWAQNGEVLVPMKPNDSCSYGERSNK